MSMTRKDFAAIAEALRKSSAPVATILAIARVCRESSASFNREKFYSAAINNESQRYAITAAIFAKDTL